MNFKHTNSHSNIFAIHGHLQFKLLTRIYFGGDSEFSSEDPETSTDDWGLVDECGQRYLLPKTMLFMGREECDIVVKSQSVDKRHAVITFDHYLNRFKIKDLSTVNGTYVNNIRIQDQEYVTLKHMDSVRLGTDSMVYYMEQIEEKSAINLDDDINIPPPPTMPAWATRELASLAECEGCIAEQKLCHTCGGERKDVYLEEDAEDEVHIHTSHHRDKTKDSNTWPRKRVRNTQNIATFFPDNSSFDDSESGHRILRGEGSIPENLPPELETVKKCTPLYGQPDWWGEEEAYDKNSNSEKPSNLSLQNNVGISENSPPSEIDNSKASILSKDSLISHKSGEMDTPESPEKNSVSTCAPKPADGSISMAFTVEFDEESPKMNISGKLEDFMPSKVRRSFRGRTDKRASKSSEDSFKEEKSSSRGSSPTRKSSSRGSSPARQKKIDELWESSEKSRKPMRRNSSGASDYREESKTSHSIKELNNQKRKLSSGGLTRGKSLKTKESEVKLEPEVNESASYLIDKMFSSGTTKSPLKSPKSDRFSEHALYREAKLYEFGKDSAKDTGTPKKITRQPLLKKIPTEEEESVPAKIIPVEAPKKQEDNVSESGTYTIEADAKPKEEEEKAREDIDKAFGITDNYLSQTSAESGIKIQDTVENGDVKLEDIEDQIDELEKVRTRGPEAESLDVEVGSDILTELKIVEDGIRIRRRAKRPTSWKDDMKSREHSKWMSQLEALTSKPKSPSHDLASPRSNPDEMQGTRKPPSGSKKRPGTGRKLPRLPNDKGSPSGSETSSRMSERSSKLSECTTSPRCLSTPNELKRNVTISDKVINRYDDTDTETVSKTKFETDSESNFTRIESDTEKTPLSSRSSGASIDTDILLQDTEDVVAAVGNKKSMKSSSKSLQNGHDYSYMNGKSLLNGKSHVNGDYHDSESMVAYINGDEEFDKPSDYGSPRENLAKSTKAKATTNKKPLTRVYSTSSAQRLQKFKETNLKRTMSTGDQSAVSDVLSESDTSTADLSLDLSTFEDNNTEINRKGSKGKGTISMTRPNRAFQLRRQRADGDAPTTPGSDISDSSFTSVTKTPTRNARTPTTTSSRTSKTPTSSLRGLGSRTPTGVSSNSSLSFSKSVGSRQSWHGSSSRTDLTVTGISKGRSGKISDRSDVSLGAQIQRKGEDNARTSNLARTETGRHSLKLNKSLSTLDNSSSDVRKSDLKSFKNRLKTTQSYGLSVSGVGNKTQSQTQSGTSATRSAEEAAWKRRKEYDPRRAVAEAKTKSKEKQSTTSSSSLTSMKRMTRSSSFTNSSELGRNRKDKNDSLSSAEGTDTFDDSSIASSHRGFIPYSGRSQSSHLYKTSSEDEELSLVAKSGQSQDASCSEDLSRCLLGSKPHLSAFTPPPPKLASPLPRPRSLYNKRHSVTGDTTDFSDIIRQYHNNVLSQSYDNILVSSIYQLSHKLKSKTNHVVHRLRDEDRLLVNSPSPIDDIIDQSMNSEMPAWKSANQELAGILSNLRKIEHHLRCLNRVLFPGEVSPSDSAMSGREKQEYLQEIERIRGELAGFQPIANKEDTWKLRHDDESVESDCEELGGAEEFF
ncbi:centrosomal protein of 170 kDa protein B-like isoform X4 [Mytilus californianus]|uniref:centrosomal protein of 170 kDa protein B-like isoform X4 n=1 Tax=Mytilus californianus TaxID=6549 RepID=UPI00224857CC|nr:centrosomal protein of 170 kDa protein B-like isoform X4 [Mytilus californianus]